MTVDASLVAMDDVVGGLDDPASGLLLVHALASIIPLINSAIVVRLPNMRRGYS